LTRTDCLVCRKHAGEPAPPGGPILADELVVASHVFDLEGTGEPAYLGHLVVEPRRHVPGLGDLTDDEAAAVGRTLAALARALVATEGAEHVYSAVMGHHVAHLHVHLFPRYPGTPREYWFLRVDEWPDAPKGGAHEIAAVATRLRAALA
jgi:diadenosine tetraphosphate (Ap4A) HIT family hydrolase